MRDALKKIAGSAALSENEMAAAMTSIMDGKVSDADIAAFLTALAKRDPTADEITGAARILRQKAQTIKAPADAVDIGQDRFGRHHIIEPTDHRHLLD